MAAWHSWKNNKIWDFSLFEGNTMNRSGWNSAFEHRLCVYSSMPNLVHIGSRGVGTGAPKFSTSVTFVWLCVFIYTGSSSMPITMKFGYGRVHHWPALTCQIWPTQGLGRVHEPPRLKNFVKISVIWDVSPLPLFFSFPSLFLFPFLPSSLPFSLSSIPCPFPFFPFSALAELLLL